MLVDQLTYIFSWYFYSFVFGLLGFLTIHLLLSWEKVGKLSQSTRVLSLEVNPSTLYAFSRFFGLAVFGFFSWLFFDLFPIPFTFIPLVVLLMFSLLFLFFFQHKRLDLSKSVIKELFFVEFLYFCVFLSSVLYLAYFPDATRPEDFMNLGFISSLIRGKTIPPQDMWFSGYSINYYYFGHFLNSILVLLSGVPVVIAFNLILANLISNVFIMAYGLVKEITKSSLYGILSSYLIVISGNLYLWFVLFRKGFINSNDFVNSVRFIAPDSSDFPSYSFWQSGLHANVFGIQVIILALFFGFLIIKSPRINAQTFFEKVFRIKFKYILFASFCLGLGFFTNSWDFVGIFLYFVFCFLFYFLREDPGLQSVDKSLKAQGFKRKNITDLFHAVVVLSLCLLVSMALFSLFFSNAPLSSIYGVGFSYNKSGPLNIFIMFGVFLVPIFVWFLSLLRSYFKATGVFCWDSTELFLLSLLFVSFILILFPDVLYVKDYLIVDAPTFSRSNTVWKLWYQAWILLSVGVPILVWYLHSKSLKALLLFLIILSGSLYPMYFFTAKMLETADTAVNTLTLDATYYLGKSNPDAYHALNFLNTLTPINNESELVLLDVPGIAYESSANILSSYTGIPTVLGWVGHEKVLRKPVDLIIQREYDVQRLYQSTSDIEILDLLDKYKITHFVISPNLYLKYGPIAGEYLKNFGKPVFISDTYIIYEVTLDKLPLNIGFL